MKRVQECVAYGELPLERNADTRAEPCLVCCNCVFYSEIVGGGEVLVGRLLGGNGVGVGWEVGAAGSVGGSGHMRDPCEKQIKQGETFCRLNTDVNKLVG